MTGVRCTKARRRPACTMREQSCAGAGNAGVMLSDDALLIETLDGPGVPGRIGERSEASFAECRRRASAGAGWPAHSPRRVTSCGVSKPLRTVVGLAALGRHRDGDTATACALAHTRGARLFRVHSVKQTADALLLTRAIDS